MDIANLGITVNSAQLLLAAERMDKMGGAAKAIENRLYGFNTSAKRTETALSRIADRANGATKVFSGFKNVLQIAGIDLATKEVMRFADTWVNAGNKIKAASQASGMQSRSLNQLRSGADNARTGLEEYVSLYSHILRNSKGVAQSEEDIAKATNLVSKAFVLGGTTASEQAASILQLGQALGSGVLEGDELRSISENAPLLAQVIADGFGTTVEGLKKFGAEGEITTAKFLQLILAAGSTIESQFQKMPITMEQGVTLVQNAGLQYIGTMNEITGASHLIGGGLQILANNMDLVGNAMLAFSAISAGRIFGPMIAEPAKTLSSILSLDAAFLKSNATMLNTRSVALARAKSAHEVALADKNAAAAALQAAQADRVRAVAALEAAKAGQLVGMTRAQAAGQLVLANKAVNAASLTMAAQSKTTAQTLGVMNIAMKNASFSARAMSIAMGGLSFLGGPLGVAILGVGTALYMQSERAEKAIKAIQQLQEEWKSTGVVADESAKKTNETLDNVSQENAKRRLLRLKDLQKQYLGTDLFNLVGYGENLSALEHQAKSLQRLASIFSSSEEKAQIKFDNSSIEQALSLVNDLRSGKITVDQYLADLKEIQKTNVSQPIYDWISALGEAGGVVKGFKTEMLSLGYTPELDNMLGKLDEIKQTFLDLQGSGTIGIAGPEGKKQIEDLFSEVSKGGQEAVIAKDKLRELLGGTVYGEHLLSILNEVSSEIGRIINQNNELMGKANELSGKRYLNSLADAAKPVTDKIMQGVDFYQQYLAGEEYVKTLEQQNKRTRAEVDYDNRLADVRAANPNLTPEQQKRAVNSGIERDNRLKDEDKASRCGGNKGLERDANAYRELVKSGDDRIAQIELETQLARKAGIAADAYRMKLELEQHATDKGRKLTAEKAAEIANLSKRYEEAATAAAKAKLNADLNNERTRMGLSTVEQGVYDKMNQYNIPYGSNQQAAAAIRYNSILQMGLGYAQSFANTLTAGLVNGTKFTESLGSAFKNLGNQILSMATNDLISGLFRNLLGLGGGGGWLNSLLSGLGGSYPAAPSPIGPVGLYANGGAFGTGSQRFARGGAFTNSIISKPTPFRFADGGGFSSGLMGEAGPEAILPLKRDAQGRLGVSQHGEGGNRGGSGTLTNVSVDVKASKYFDVIVGQKAQQVSQQSIKQFAQSPQLKQVAEQVSRSVIGKPSKRF